MEDIIWVILGVVILVIGAVFGWIQDVLDSLINGGPVYNICVVSFLTGIYFSVRREGKFVNRPLDHIFDIKRSLENIEKILQEIQETLSLSDEEDNDEWSPS